MLFKATTQSIRHEIRAGMSGAVVMAIYNMHQTMQSSRPATVGLSSVALTTCMGHELIFVIILLILLQQNTLPQGKTSVSRSISPYDRTVSLKCYFNIICERQVSIGTVFCYSLCDVPCDNFGSGYE